MTGSAPTMSGRISTSGSTRQPDQRAWSSRLAQGSVGLRAELEREPDPGAERVAFGAPAVRQRLNQLEAAAVHAQRVWVVDGCRVQCLAAAVAHRDGEGGLEGGPELGAAAGVDDRVGDQLGEAELGGGGDVVGDLGALEELAQEPTGGRG